MKFGECLRMFRRNHSLKLNQTAELLGISPSYLSSIENGTRCAPSFELLEKTADLLGLNERERFQLYDLAAETKQPPAVADDLREYICQTPEIRELLRYAMKRRLTQAEWQEILTFVRNNYG